MGITHLKAPFKRKKYSYRKRSLFFPFRRSYRSGRNKSIESSPSFPLPYFLLSLQCPSRNESYRLDGTRHPSVSRSHPISLFPHLPIIFLWSPHHRVPPSPHFFILPSPSRVVDKNGEVMYPYNKEVRNHAREEDVQEPDHLAQGDC